MRDRLEEILAGSPDARSRRHMSECPECRDEVAAMQEQGELLRRLRAPREIEPGSGFYSRVMDRIEAQRAAASIWTLFADSTFGRRIAAASMALALLLSIYVVSSEHMANEATAAASEHAALFSADGLPQGGVLRGEPAVMLTGAPDEDEVLVNLVTYPQQ